MRKVMIAVVAMAAALTVRTAQAQEQATTTRAFQFGPQIDWGTDTDFGIGGRVVWNALGETIAVRGLEGVASFDVFFPGNDVNWWELNANITYPIAIPSAPRISPYFGGGLNIAHASVSGVDGSGHTDVGVNLLGGTRFGIGILQAFVEGRLELHSGSQFVATFGLLF